MPPKRLEEVLEAFNEDRSINVLYTDISAQQTNVLDHTDLEITSKEFHYLPQLVFHRDCFDWIGQFDTDLVAHCDDEIWLRINSLHLPHHISSENTTIAVCPDCYHQYSPLNAAIGYRQLLVKYTSLLQRNNPAKKKLYQKAAYAYQKAGVFHRYRSNSKHWPFLQRIRDNCQIDMQTCPLGPLLHGHKFLHFFHRFRRQWK